MNLLTLLYTAHIKLGTIHRRLLFLCFYFIFYDKFLFNRMSSYILGYILLLLVLLQEVVVVVVAAVVFCMQMLKLCFGSRLI